MSVDYCNGNPYPAHAFGVLQWPTDRGPTPTALPIPTTIIGHGADFLLKGGAPRFTVPYEANAALQAADVFLREQVIAANQIEEQYYALAEACGQRGAIAAKFSYDGDDPVRPVRIAFLHVPTECRVWFDPHDQFMPVFARIQYPFRDPASGDWYYFREEWTADEAITYAPIHAGSGSVTSVYDLPGYRQSLGDDAEWTVLDRTPNAFGLLPITIIRNRRQVGNPLGEGDMWRWLGLVDRVSLTLHDSDRWNQHSSHPNLVITNAENLPTDPVLNGEELRIASDNPAGPHADAKLIEPMGYAREWVMQYADRLERYAWEAAGYSYVDLAAIGNKGAWTKLAFEVTFSKTIATTDRKRELWGRSGLCVFYQNLLRGLAQMGGIAGLDAVDLSTRVSCEWPPYFEATDQDLSMITDRTVTQMGAGLITLERAIDRIARAEKVPDHEIKTMVEELVAEAEAEAAEQDAADAAKAASGTPPAGEDDVPAPSDAVHPQGDAVTVQIAAVRGKAA